MEKTISKTWNDYDIACHEDKPNVISPEDNNIYHINNITKEMIEYVESKYDFYVDGPDDTIYDADTFLDCGYLEVDTKKKEAVFILN